MYFFGKIAFIAAIAVFAVTFQTVGEGFALLFAAITWFVVTGIGRTIVSADQDRTARKRRESYMAEVVKATHNYEEHLTQAHTPGARQQRATLPEWAHDLTPNRKEWLREKLAEPTIDGLTRSQVEQKLKVQLLEWGWIE